MPFSQIETDYQQRRQRIDVKIIDTAASAMMLMPFG